ncbi:MAG: L-threonylcarbamoyladenylate synthase [Tagaea sp.]|nr:L-threonylcarbamoyladenylate synthase [Tagaea sp.]
MRLLPPTKSNIARAASTLRAGRLVAFPTETVYGLGARADDPRAVARIYAAKGRPRFNPLIAHVPDIAAAKRAAAFDARAELLADLFWPGPLTLVLPVRGQGVCLAARAGLDSVGVRVPAHPVARALLRRAGVPIAAPSANPSGKLSPTTALDVARGLGARVDLVLDGGACAVGLESTIVDLTGSRARLLRPGGVPVEAIAAAIGDLAAPEGTIKAPGMLASHYAPRAKLRLDAASPMPGEAYLGFGGLPARVEGLDLSPSGDLAEAARNLFAYLRALDRAGEARIAVASIPARGLGRAIRDRLARAAAPSA